MLAGAGAPRFTGALARIGGFSCTQPASICSDVVSPGAAVVEPRPPRPSKFSAVVAVFSVDAENATSWLAMRACQAAELASVVAVPVAPGPTNLR